MTELSKYYVAISDNHGFWVNWKSGERYTDIKRRTREDAQKDANKMFNGYVKKVVVNDT